MGNNEFDKLSNNTNKMSYYCVRENLEDMFQQRRSRRSCSLPREDSGYAYDRLTRARSVGPMDRFLPEPAMPFTTWSCLVPDMQGTYHHCGTPTSTHQDITTMTTRKISTGRGHTSTTMTARTTFHLAHTIHPMNHIGLKLVHLGPLAMVTTLKIGTAMAMITLPTMTCHCATTMAITSTMTMPTVAALMC